MRRRSWWLVGFICSALLSVSMVAPSSPALALTPPPPPPYKPVPQSKTYSVTRCIHLATIGTYVQATASGTIAWNLAHSSTMEFFANVTVRNPTLTVSSRTSCASNAGYITRSRSEVGQSFYAENCSYNAGIGVSFPWGVSLAPTYSCGRTDVGTRSTSYGQASKWIQNNTGAPVNWGDSIPKGVIGGPGPAWPCLDMKISATVYNGTNVSDSVIWGDNEALHALSC